MIIMKKVIKYISLACTAILLVACDAQDETVQDWNDADVIHVGGVNTDRMLTTTAVTRAAEAAEGIDWLSAALKQGMDITYLSKTDSRKALLKLEVDQQGQIQKSAGGLTVYSLTAYDNDGKLTTTPAKWLDNGAHSFQGVYVPESLKSQSTAQDYDSQIHYTAVPPSYDISATVGRITIPLQHRLARVVAYVLIDPGMSTTLKGYQKGAAHNGEATQLRFCNVKTLKYVDANDQPVWQQERKAIPHYMGEQFITVYKEKASGKFIFPIDEEYSSATADASNYEPIDYGSCPYYDIIVRPTYTARTTGTNVMYDEATDNRTEGAMNQIDFELTLANDLEYEKEFEFDLNANDETVVYLRVSPERIDYNSAGSRLWKESSYADDYYGVNNENGNNLSLAGSSWQRAFTNDTIGAGVTDGHFYDADEEDTNAQYVSSDKLIELLKEATIAGAHHGDYFILKNDITIDLSKFPEDFVFTGHLDAQDHTITLTGGTDAHNWLFAGINGIYTTDQEAPNAATNVIWEANVHKEGNTWVPTLGWRAEVVNLTITGGKLLKDRNNVSGYLHHCQDADGVVTDYTPALPTY